ncbi:TetR/AcrR family transcriptional regulator [Cryobacterium adonitolivorans]|uniref:TetR/AcrR family transcriptional regulator n=1 Tax=Cryobacterium adonitolivorans TaxID=1259189 RepID=A0A4R8W8K3_9MICO|nr:TetR/AcrR family transcriptional regulator [Cryobacterium adonitolivorans]TFC04076.1 TetR/AcrR family transcriptional regulator [Cryobacterium adonitolivorans]
MKRPGLTEARLVQAAAELADESGLPAVTLSALARRFDVRPASIYSHLGGLDDLLDLTAAFALQELANALAEALPGKAGRGALFAFADAHRDYATAHPGRWQAAQRRVSPEAAARSAGGVIARSARAIMSGYGLTPDDEVHAVRLLGSAINGFVALEAGGGFDHSVPPATVSWTRVLDAIDTSLRNWPTADARHPDRSTD